jgi:hypothetical protein
MPGSALHPQSCPLIELQEKEPYLTTILQKQYEILISLIFRRNSRAAGYCLLLFVMMMKLRAGSDQDIVNGDTEESRESKEIIHGRKGLPPLPFVDCLRGIKAEEVLQISHSQATGETQACDILPCRREIDDGITVSRHDQPPPEKNQVL